MINELCACFVSLIKLQISMDNIHVKDTRILQSQPDLKNNSNKTLPKIWRQLQTGSLLKATIIVNDCNVMRG